MSDERLILSRLLLNPRDRTVARDLSDIYQLHRSVMSGFPEHLPTKERVLFRLEAEGAGQPLLLVQSQSTPDWSKLPAGYLWPSELSDRLPNPALKPVEPVFQPGRTLRFRLRANPTVKKSTEPGRQGRRVGIVGEEKQLAWLARKGKTGGFRPLDGVNVATVGRAFGLGRKRPKAGDAAAEAAGDPAAWPRAHVELLVVQFDGVLEVTDPTRFGETLLSGIGSAKGFGCGLLSLARA